MPEVDAKGRCTVCGARDLPHASWCSWIAEVNAGSCPKGSGGPCKKAVCVTHWVGLRKPPPPGIMLAGGRILGDRDKDQRRTPNRG